MLLSGIIKKLQEKMNEVGDVETFVAGIGNYGYVSLFPDFEFKQPDASDPSDYLYCEGYRILGGKTE